MRIAFLSDLHLAPSGTNRCTTPADALCALLDELEQRAQRVVLLGDAFDLLRPERLRGWREQLAALWLEHPELMARLEALEPIHGNHDAPMRALGWPEQRAFQHSGIGSILATHGHQWDVWLKKIWGMEEAANFGAGWFERLGLDVVSVAMGAVPTLLEQLQEPLSQRRARAHTGAARLPRDQRGVQALMEQGWDVVVAAHTHGLGLYPMGERLYINTGSHAHGHRDAVLLDTQAGVALSWRDEQVVQQVHYDGVRWHEVASGEEPERSGESRRAQQWQASKEMSP